jgi:hypothetical protein
VIESEGMSSSGDQRAGENESPAFTVPGPGWDSRYPRVLGGTMVLAGWVPT